MLPCYRRREGGESLGSAGSHLALVHQRHEQPVAGQEHVADGAQAQRAALQPTSKEPFGFRERANGSCGKMQRDGSFSSLPASAPSGRWQGSGNKRSPAPRCIPWDPIDESRVISYLVFAHTRVCKGHNASTACTKVSRASPGGAYATLSENSPNR
jgi:hypothetical protein